MTGFVDPRLQMMSSSFMPANLSAPYAAGGAPQLQPNPQQQFGGMSLQQSFQQHNQQVGRGATPKIPWALSKAEKKNYDQIFRAWDVQGTGFISGQTALEVFGQSGIDRNELAKIWSLADSDNRGKLNLAEFHVAMGLIYRRLNGSEVPDELPPELVPPSSRDLDTSVNFLKDILKNDTRARSPSALDTPVSRLKERSFTSPSTTLTQQGGRQDATVYRHEDVPPPGGFYQSSVRHIDRNAVRSQSDEANPAASDIASLKRQLLDTQKMLDDKLSSERESDQLDRDLEDLRYRIKRLQEDLEYDEERRRLERELVPELERKVEEREARKEREKRKWANERDKRNERFGRFAGEEGGRYSPAHESRYGSEDDRPYSRNERDYYDRDERKPYRSDESDRQQDREKVADVRAATRSPPAAAPVVPAPATSRSPAPQLKNMTPEQRRAFIQAEAKRRLEDPPTSAVSPTLDTEKREAEEKAREAERQAEERQQVRKQKLEAERAIKAGKTPAPTPTAPAAPPAPKTPATVAAPAPAPAPPVQAFVPAPAPAPAPALAPPAPTEPEEDPEDVALRARGAALRKKREEREALLRRLEEEERMSEEAYQQRRTQFLAAKAAASPCCQSCPVYTPPAPAPAPLTPEVEAEEAVAPPPPPPPPPAPPASAAADKPNNNPFNRLKKDGNAPALETTSSPANVGNSNPFFRVQGVPPPVKTTYHTVPSGSDDDWDDVVEKEEDNSSDEELATRDTRVGLAQQLFGSLLPARPQSAGPAPQSTGNAVSPTPPPPTAPPAPAAPAPPPAPVAPAPPRSPAPVTPSAAPGDRGALLSAIQGGAALRKTVTNDRSAAATAGKVVGDNIVPAHINSTPRPPSPLSPPAPAARALSANEVPEPLPVESTLTSKHRPAESVDWYNELAADHAGQVTLDHLPETVEEEEEYAEDVPAITVSEHVPGEVSDPMADVTSHPNRVTELRVRSLYLYEAQRTEDLLIEAHPSKSGSDWWYGTTVNDGRSGFFPQTYVQVVEPGSTPDELSFTEGDVLTIVDRMESDWWKAERDGLVYLVPAAYVEVAEASGVTCSSAGGERVDSVPDRETMSNDSYGTPYSSPAKTRKLDRMPEITGTDNDEDDDDDDYYSLDDDGASDVSEASDVDATETLADQERQEMERRRVLEAAGVIVSDLKDHNRSLPPVPMMDISEDSEAAGHTGTNARLSPISEMLSTSVQPTHLKTTSESSSTSRVDDAFERYETYKKLHGGQSLAANRMSASSFDTSSSLTFSSPPRSPAVSLSPSLRDKEQERGGESRHLALSEFPWASHTTAQGFGTSWASLVDKTALEGIPAVERKRQEAIFELISTEADYVRDLQLIVEVKDSTSVIFSNIEDILLTNTAFLSTLEERQRECRLYVDHVGDLLETHMPHMRVYLAYCVNQANGGKVLQSLRHTNPELSTQLQCLREDPSARNLDLASYLLVPMQRLTRYPLLIRQILQYTDPPASTLDLSSAPRLTLSLPTEHAERESIANALACAEKILGEVNETIRGRESWARLGQVSRELRIGKDRLDLTLPTHHLGPRMLLKEGVLTKARSGRRLRALLCSDLLLLINESGGGGIYRVPLPVHELDIRTSRNHFRSDDAYIRIHRAYPRGGDTLVLRAPSVREARAWTEAIVQAAARAKEGIRRLSVIRGVQR
ncbi:hypothetical protein EDC04DRAFT_2868580 [Pisolithus marmoratus]|nr:hypothetical protein EDC04DRAFT_2868580 [Pisolithus marmoratus]